MPKKSRDQLGQEMKAELVRRMKQVGIQPQIIYAYEKCEFLVTEMNRHLIDAEQMAEWEAAIDEYFELHGDDDRAKSDGE